MPDEKNLCLQYILPVLPEQLILTYLPHLLPTTFSQRPKVELD